MFEGRLESEEKQHRGVAFLSTSMTTTLLAAAITTVRSSMGGREDRDKTCGTAEGNATENRLVDASYRHPKLI
jgi:hypothetical protein